MQNARGRPIPAIDSEHLRRTFNALEGGYAGLARDLRVTRQALDGWLNRGYVPAERVLEVERLTGVPRHELRPDIYPAPEAAQ